MTANEPGSNPIQPAAFSRRDFVRACALGASFLASSAVVGCVNLAPPSKGGAARLTLSLDQGWLFGGKFIEGADQPGFADASFKTVTLPHCGAKLSWENWKAQDWEEVWIYRRHFQVPNSFRKRRIFLDFDRVTVTALPTLNGHALLQHAGGYLPFQYEVTDLLKEGDNVLAVAVDSRWQDVPPEGNPKGPPGLDYFEPGGITGSVKLRALPQVFISDVFAKPVNVLQPGCSVEITCTIDAAMLPDKPLQVKVDMLDGHEQFATVSQTVKLEKTGETQFKLRLGPLKNAKLWDVDSPHLYGIVTTLIGDGHPLHEHRTRIGLREARFEVDGFFLNGRRLRLFGLNRHELYPYVGMAMPGRVMRRDAEILRHEFNCNIVRCSHYPQTEAFLDACDELGLMVWEEPPGWGYLGNAAWEELVVRDVHDMIVRDRNHPAIVIWGVRVNESHNEPVLYQRTTALAKALDDSRPDSGSMTNTSKATVQNWKEDVFALDYYHSAKDGSVGIEEPLPNLPYMLAETVGQYSYGLNKKGFNNIYRRAGDLELQTLQAVYHAQAHDKAAAFPNFCGVIGWCAFEYGSPMNAYNGIKCPGVADVFRIPKLGASFYQAQISPKARPVIKLSFYWDFGPKSPRGPGSHSAIFSNCERLEVFVAGKLFAIAKPDRKNYPQLAYPPFFCDLEFEGAGAPELRIDGYLGDKLALSRSFSSDKTQDQFLAQVDDAELLGDGIDATRLSFCVADKFGEPRAYAGGRVAFELTGPAVIVGDNPVCIDDSGGVGAVWIKSVVGGSGRVTVKATHSILGQKTVMLRVR